MGCALHQNKARHAPENRDLLARLRELEAILEARCPIDGLMREISQAIVDLEIHHPPYLYLPNGRIARSEKLTL